MISLLSRLIDGHLLAPRGMEKLLECSGNVAGREDLFALALVFLELVLDVVNKDKQFRWKSIDSKMVFAQQIGLTYVH